MGAPAAVLTSRPHTAATPARLLHGWHLLSLDAPTVAFCWTLLFAYVLRVPHAFPAAAALACAVWLVYVGDRVLDARREAAQTAWQGPSQARLPRLYRERARAFLLAGVAAGGITLLLLAELPRSLAEAWFLLGVPLALYAAAVHLLRLSGRWKAVSVGLFFGVAVALPAAVHGNAGWPLASAALAFGGVCRANCAVLRAPGRRLRIVLGASGAAALLPSWFAETRAIGLACIAALALLVVLMRKRNSMDAQVDWLSWRALVDAALVAPPLLVMAGVLLAR